MSVATKDDPPGVGGGLPPGPPLGSVDLQAYEDLLRVWWENLIAAVCSMTRCSREEAEDALSEALLSAFERGKPFATTLDLYRWVREVAKNRILRGRSARAGASPEQWEAVLDVAEVVILQQECQATREDILALPASQRQVLALRVIDDLPPRQIAAELRMDVMIVKSRIAEARRTLRARRRRRGYGSAVLIPVAAWRAIRRCGKAGGAATVSAVGLMTWIAVTTAPVAVPLDAPSDWADSASEQPSGALRGASLVAPRGGARARVGTIPLAPPRTATNPESAGRVVHVGVEGLACVSGAACAGTGSNLPESHSDIAYVRTPPVAGLPERYVYVQAPEAVTSNVAPWACDAVPDTALTGCQPGAGSPSSPTVPEGKA